MPDKVALRDGDRSWTYRQLAADIAWARSFFVQRSMTGAGIAVMVMPDLVDFWVTGIALRSLGLTTIAVATSGMWQTSISPICVVSSSWPRTRRH